MIKIAGKEYPYKMTVTSAVIYCEKRGIELWQYEEDISSIDFEKITINAVKIMRDLIHACILSADPEADVNPQDIVDEFSNVDFLTKFFAEFFGKHPKGSDTVSTKKKQRGIFSKRKS